MDPLKIKIMLVLLNAAIYPSQIGIRREDSAAL